MKVLPLPVAIWMRARGWLAAREVSRLPMATAWTGQSLPASMGREVAEVGAELGGAEGGEAEELFGAVEGEDFAAGRDGDRGCW